MEFMTLLVLLVLHAGCLESKDIHHRKRFKEIKNRAKKTAIDDYVNLLLGKDRVVFTGTRNYKDENDVRTILEDFEIMVYARRLSTLLQQQHRSCNDWWCGSDKATSFGPPTTTSSSEPTQSGIATTTITTETHSSSPSQPGSSKGSFGSTTSTPGANVTDVTTSVPSKVTTTLKSSTPETEHTTSSLKSLIVTMTPRNCGQTIHFTNLNIIFVAHFVFALLKVT